MDEWGDPVLHGLGMTERAKPGEALFWVLREVRQLFTRKARESLASFLTTGPKGQDIKEFVDRAAHDQWVSWHWTPENPVLHPSVRMLFASLFAYYASAFGGFPTSIHFTRFLFRNNYKAWMF